MIPIHFWGLPAWLMSDPSQPHWSLESQTLPLYSVNLPEHPTPLHRLTSLPPHLPDPGCHHLSLKCQPQPLLWPPQGPSCPPRVHAPSTNQIALFKCKMALFSPPSPGSHPPRVKAQVHLVAPKALPDLPRHPLPSPPPSPPLAHSAPATRAHVLFLQHTRPGPIPGSLHMLVSSVPRTLFPQVFL